MIVVLLLQRVWLMLLLVPALVGTLVHVVPFTIVRLLAERIQGPGKTKMSLSRTLVGVPVYGLWYAALGWWLYHTFTPWFATVWLLALPFLGMLALQYWGRTWEALVLRWQQLRFFWSGERLAPIREQQRQLREKLSVLAQEYEDALPGTQAPPKSARWPKYRLASVWATAAVLLAGVVGLATWTLRDRPLFNPDEGFDLQTLTTVQLESDLDRDEKSLQSIMRGIDELEARTRQVHDDFAAGRRSYASETDNDAVRQLLLSYLNYRTALIRLIWKYQGYAQVSDERQQLRAFLVGFTSASVLGEASTKLVHQFADRPEAVARLNEGEPIWNIPAGMFDQIERTLRIRRMSICWLPHARTTTDCTSGSMRADWGATRNMPRCMPRSPGVRTPSKLSPDRNGCRGRQSQPRRPHNWLTPCATTRRRRSRPGSGTSRFVSRAPEKH